MARLLLRPASYSQSEAQQLNAASLELEVKNTVHQTETFKVEIFEIKSERNATAG